MNPITIEVNDGMEMPEAEPSFSMPRGPHITTLPRPRSMRFQRRIRHFEAQTTDAVLMSIKHSGHRPKYMPTGGAPSR